MRICWSADLELSVGEISMVSNFYFVERKFHQEQKGRKEIAWTYLQSACKPSLFFCWNIHDLIRVSWMSRFRVSWVILLTTLVETTEILEPMDWIVSSLWFLCWFGLGILLQFMTVSTLYHTEARECTLLQHFHCPNMRINHNQGWVVQVLSHFSSNITHSVFYKFHVSY